MKAAVRRKLAAAGVVEGPVPAAPVPTPMQPISTPSPLLVADPFLRQCLLQLNEGNTLSLRDVEGILRMKREKVRLLFAHRPGVFKIGKDYRIPRLVFDRMLAEMMNRR